MGAIKEDVDSIMELPDYKLKAVYNAVICVRKLESIRVLEVAKEDITKYQEALRQANNAKLLK